MNSETKLKGEYLNGFDKGLFGRKVGFELEYPLVYAPGHQKAGELISSEDVRKLFKAVAREDSGYEFIDGGWALQKDYKGYAMYVGTDCSSGQLETGLPPSLTLAESAANVREVVGPISEIAERMQIYILGYGMQPFSAASKSNIMPKPRYDAIEAFLGKSFYPHSLSAANQVHVDVNNSTVIGTVNVLNAFAPAILAVSANASVVLGKDTGFADYRARIWDQTQYQVFAERNRNRTGIVQFGNMEDYWNFLLEFPPVLTKRDGKYLMYLNTPSLRDYISRGETKAVVLGEGTKLTITPQMVDVHFLEGTVWWEARPKAIYGTVESRCPALQPSVSEITAVGALIFGLSLNVNKAYEFSKGMVSDTVEANRAREDASVNGLNARSVYPVREVAREMLDLAKEGLRMRRDDAGHLDPLYERLENDKTPSQRSAEVLKKKGPEEFLRYVRLRFD